MQLRSLAMFSVLALTAGLASADPCMKVRRGEAHACMTSSASAKRVAVEATEFAPAAAGHVRTLTTPSFIVRITVNCAEGNVTCDDVIYAGTSRKTGKSISLRGKTRHGMCADRVTPCSFQGYEFRNGKTTYRVLDDGTLSVLQHDKVLLEERGRWE